MSEEMTMWISFAIFMGLPIVIMGLAWMTDRADEWGKRSTDR